MADEPQLGEMFALDDGDIPPTATVETPAPKKRGRPAGSTNRASGERAPRRGSRTWIKSQCATLVGLGNLAISFSPFKDDALDEKEMDLLSDALVAEAMSSERIMSWMMKAAAISPHILLIQAVVAISIPRLQKHGYLPTIGESNAPQTPEQVEAWLHEQASRTSGGNAGEDASTVPVGAGSAPIHNWWDRQRENHAS